MELVGQIFAEEYMPLVSVWTHFLHLENPRSILGRKKMKMLLVCIAVCTKNISVPLNSDSMSLK